MTITEGARLMASLAEVNSSARLTFANNKVDVTKIVYDEKSNSVNLR